MLKQKDTFGLSLALQKTVELEILDWMRTSKKISIPKKKKTIITIIVLETCKDATVGYKLVQPSVSSTFRRVPRCGVEQTQVNELTTLIQQIILSPMQDRWIWTLNNSGGFSVASIRNRIDSMTLTKGVQKTR
nr:RNA-directed DNA polymerase, eukaryota, reverse transcriptase zinc-binding domain protein [Tanacetum cinerariifolium]